jgi:hypothetical protein
MVRIVLSLNLTYPATTAGAYFGPRQSRTQMPHMNCGV